jgi:hypothetical protein
VHLVLVHSRSRPSVGESAAFNAEAAALGRESVERRRDEFNGSRWQQPGDSAVRRIAVPLGTRIDSGAYEYNRKSTR